MTAPRGIEFNQSVFAIVRDDLIKVLGDSYSYWAIRTSWDWLRFQEWLQFPCCELFEECGERLHTAKLNKRSRVEQATNTYVE